VVACRTKEATHNESLDNEEAIIEHYLSNPNNKNSYEVRGMPFSYFETLKKPRNLDWKPMADGPSTIKLPVAQASQICLESL
jgi:hypothetical protein